jgi:cell wall-associated NlpC family hydrolase
MGNAKKKKSSLRFSKGAETGQTNKGKEAASNAKPPGHGVGIEDAAADPKPRKRRKLKTDVEKATERQAHLRFGKADVTVQEASSMNKAQRRAMYAASAAAAPAHKEISKYEDDNVGVQAAHQTEEAGETVGCAVGRSRYSKKLKTSKQAQKLQQSEGNANSTMPEKRIRRAAAQNSEGSSNPFSRWKQRHDIHKGYAAAQSGAAKAGGSQTASSTANAAEKAGGAVVETTKSLVSEAVALVSENAHWLILLGMLAALLLIVLSFFSSCSVIFPAGNNIMLGTSYTAEDKEIIAANNDYTELEKQLREQVDSIKTTYPGYDEYDIQTDEINHNPYVLTAYLTVKYEYYTEAQVQAELQNLFEKQYKLTVTPETQIRTRKVPLIIVDPVTFATTVTYINEEYEYHILHVTLKNNTLEKVTVNSGLTTDQKERYNVLLETKGNRSYLFEDDIYSNSTDAVGSYTDYEIPAEALTDNAFANMIAEAEKYLGRAYVWGGSSPETGFDCSGYVSWVINNCGNGWNVGRQTANGLLNLCTVIPASEAQPGDLIFFQGTYDVKGASHCGIYVGNGMMIHCGDPISYTSINKSYWQEHFLCYGRLPD